MVVRKRSAPVRSTEDGGASSKDLAFVACVLFFAAILMMRLMSAQANDSQNMNKSTDWVMSHLKERLNLTEEQGTKIRQIIEESIQKRREIRNELKELRRSTDAKIGKILTEAQLEEYLKLQEERREKMRSRMRHGIGSSGY